MLKGAIKRIWVVVGCLFLVIAAIGVVVPLLPTVDFLLLAAWCFYRGSPRMHAWLLSLPWAGPTIRDWEEHRVIRPRGKVMSVIALTVVFGYLVLFADIRPWSRVLMATLGVGIATFILTRRSRRPDEHPVKLTTVELPSLRPTHPTPPPQPDTQNLAGARPLGEPDPGL